MISMLTKKTAILVDGGYYRVRSIDLWGKRSAKDRADELYRYCISVSQRNHGNYTVFSTMTVLRKTQQTVDRIRYRYLHPTNGQKLLTPVVDREG